MCGIVGYIGKEIDIAIGLEALRRLEYRGYDSAGAAWYNEKEKKIFFLKRVGPINNLALALEESSFPKSANAFLFHTRWATHGAVTEVNAHPHFDCQKKIFLVHNGIIENYKELKSELLGKGHQFVSQTDTEVLAHLIEENFQGNLEEAVKKSLEKVRGTYGLVVISQDDPGKIVAARLSSPLLIGIGKGGFLLASDPAALITRTNKVITLEDNEVVVLKRNDFSILKKKKVEFIDWSLEEMEKGKYSHFMLKEIMEEPRAIENAFRGRVVLKDGNAQLGGLAPLEKEISRAKRLFIIACGTSYYAGMVGKYMLEEYANIPTEAITGSEFRYLKVAIPENSLAIFISQSGETADTLASLREMKKKGVPTIGITNVISSSQARETDAGIYTRSGPEIAVASTKAFLGQLTALVLFTLYLGRKRNLSLTKGREIASSLLEVPQLARRVLTLSPSIEKIAQKYKRFSNFWFIGRKYNFPIALEGALKLKEISYLHAEGLPAGELKHGPLALVDKNFPTVALLPSDSVYEKMVSNIEEVKARNGPLLVIATEGNEEIKKIADDVILIPKTLELLTPLLSIIPLHLFAYYLAVALGRNVDKPRNLAKSVTVE